MAATAGRIVRRLPVVVILGATGTGKSKLAIEIARKFDGEILSADSMQVYKGLDIVTNKVTPEEMAQCTHHMISYVNPLHFQHTVVDFRNKALPIIDDILSRDRIPIIVGGTNYYIEALLWKMLVDPINNQASPEREETDPEAPPRGENKKLVLPDCDLRTPESSTSQESAPAAGEESVMTDNSAQGEASASTMIPTARDRKRTTKQLYSELQSIDTMSADRIHPNDRRKILRALEVFHTQGRRLSDILAEQHAAPGGGGISGPLRYEPTTVFSIQADRKVLDERTDRRVDQMIEAGLLKELSDFHEQYNQNRIQNNREADYTLGIFQSIGFKEFHEYLLLAQEERESDKGKALFQLGVEEMKRVTRRYARKQMTWFNSRFIKRRESQVPPVYRLDSTNPARWQDDVFTPADRVLQAVLQGEVPPISPIPQEENTNKPVYNHCATCDRVFVTLREWEEHIKGRKHRNMLKRKKRLVSEHHQHKVVRHEEAQGIQSGLEQDDETQGIQSGLEQDDETQGIQSGLEQDDETQGIQSGLTQHNKTQEIQSGSEQREETQGIHSGSEEDDETQIRNGSEQHNETQEIQSGSEQSPP